MKTLTSLLTRTELAELFKVGVEGRELARLFTHLRTEHGLSVHNRDGVIVHDPDETRRALRRHWSDCGADVLTLDIADFVPAYIPTEDELSEAAEADGLISEDGVKKLAHDYMRAEEYSASAVVCLNALLDLNLKPQRVFGEYGRKRYYNLEQVTSSLERWRGLRTGKTETSRGSGGSETFQQKLDRTGGVSRRDILVHYGLEFKSVSFANSLMMSLRRKGLQPIERCGRNYAYDAQQVEELSGMEPAKKWPDRVRTG